MLVFSNSLQYLAVQTCIKFNVMTTASTFSLSANGFSVEAYNSEQTMVLDETGGPALRPLYIIVIHNNETGITYRLKDVHFCSEYMNLNDGSGEWAWTDAKGKANSLVEKIVKKDIINLSLWKLIVRNSTKASY
jgi:hypothetical protein